MYIDKFDFIQKNNLATLCLVDQDGNPYGASMYYFCENKVVKLICAMDTKKFEVIANNDSICLVIVDEKNLSQVVIRGGFNIIKKPVSSELSTLVDRLGNSLDNIVDIPLFSLEGPKVILELKLADSDVKYTHYRMK